MMIRTTTTKTTAVRVATHHFRQQPYFTDDSSYRRSLDWPKRIPTLKWWQLNRNTRFCIRVRQCGNDLRLDRVFLQQGSVSSSTEENHKPSYQESTVSEDGLKDIFSYYSSKSFRRKSAGEPGDWSDSFNLERDRLVFYKRATIKEEAFIIPSNDVRRKLRPLKESILFELAFYKVLIKAVIMGRILIYRSRHDAEQWAFGSPESMQNFRIWSGSSGPRGDASHLADLNGIPWGHVTACYNDLPMPPSIDRYNVKKVLEMYDKRKKERTEQVKGHKQLEESTKV